LSNQLSKFNLKSICQFWIPTAT